MLHGHERYHESLNDVVPTDFSFGLIIQFEVRRKNPSGSRRVMKLGIPQSVL